MTKAKAEKIRKGIEDKIGKTTVDTEWWAYFRGFTVEEYKEFLDMAVEALEQEPKCGEWVKDEYDISHCSEYCGVRMEG